MSEPQAAHDAMTEFLSVLGIELLRPPSELSRRRHISSAASAARCRHLVRRGLAKRAGAAVVAATTLLGTSGVALAGGLPRPVQTLVADAARVLPVPLPIPYPAASFHVDTTDEVIPSEVETAQDTVIVSAEPVEPDVTGPSARVSDAAPAVTGSGDTGTWDHEWSENRLDRERATRDREEGSDGGEHWDTRRDYDRGWDDRRSDGWRDHNHQDVDRQEHQQNRSRDRDRDW